MSKDRSALIAQEAGSDANLAKYMELMLDDWSLELGDNSPDEEVQTALKYLKIRREAGFEDLKEQKDNPINYSLRTASGLWRAMRNLDSISVFDCEELTKLGFTHETTEYLLNMFPQQTSGKFWLTAQYAIINCLRQIGKPELLADFIKGFDACFPLFDKIDKELHPQMILAWAISHDPDQVEVIVNRYPAMPDMLAWATGARAVTAGLVKEET